MIYDEKHKLMNETIYKSDDINHTTSVKHIIHKDFFMIISDYAMSMLMICVAILCIAATFGIVTSML